MNALTFRSTSLARLARKRGHDALALERDIEHRAAVQHLMRDFRERRDRIDEYGIPFVSALAALAIALIAAGIAWAVFA